jgi:hydrogenase nickel incorporation protein HypA/HybF
MHELSLMEALRDLALQQAEAEGAVRIAEMTLRVGSLAGVEIEALRFAFAAVMADTIAAAAELRIEAVPAVCRCGGCGRRFAALDGVCECPSCGAISRELLQGRELQLASLEIA